VIHKEIRSRMSIGVHWGTFPLGKEHYMAPREELEVAKRELGVEEGEFLAVGHGQSVVCLGRR
jgi:N-acyl-phosphatidylethanolamine-hydrolysing phospholipase D